MKKLFLVSTLTPLFMASSFAQNVGIGTITPASKLHIKGSADASQLIIDANSTQSNSHPLIKLRKSNGTDLMWIHSDDTTNSFVGLNAGRMNNASGGGSAATYNTFIGSSAGYSNTLGYFNTANGAQALYSNTTGFLNTVNGMQALYSNTTGYFNAATGYQALYYNTIGTYNTAFGLNALLNNVEGNHNIAIGGNSGTHPSAPNIYNTISIGNDDWLNGFQNQVFIGNSQSAWIGGYKPWSVYSDGRLKKNIAEDVSGLEFIKKLRPVTYEYLPIEELITATGNVMPKNYKAHPETPAMRQSGFIAQEVEKAAQESGYAFSGVAKVKSGKELYSLSYESFVVPLVKAVQEQQQIIETQKSDIETLKTQVAELTKTVNTLMNK